MAPVIEIDGLKTYPSLDRLDLGSAGCRDVDAFQLGADVPAGTTSMARDTGMAEIL
jgi:hypothetical protein